MSKNEGAGRLQDLNSDDIEWCLWVTDYQPFILADWNGEEPMTMMACRWVADCIEEDEFAPNELAERVRERATVDGPGLIISEEHTTTVSHLKRAGGRLGLDTSPVIEELAAANREGRHPNIPKEAIYEILHEAQEESGEFGETFELLEAWYHA